MSAALAEGSSRIAHTLYKGILHTSLHSEVWGQGEDCFPWEGDQAVRGLGHSRGNSSDREWKAAERPATTARRQQESLLTRVCSSRPLSHQSPDMMNLRDKMEPVATEKLERQSWKVPRKSSVWSV